VAYPVPGQIIVAARRHFRLLTEMTDAETGDLLPLMQRLRAAQQAVLGIEHVYYFYNEDTKHHFHVWMVPRHPWMAQFGRSIAAVRPALVHARDNMRSDEEMAVVSSAIEQIKNAMDVS
jgi:diadenosine tetraphosphate (Ap4A) HIT family hydrolase